MKKGLLVLVGGWTLLHAGLIGLARAEAPRLTVRVNNMAGFDTATVARAERIAGNIFEKAGVQVDWQSANESEILPAGLATSSGKRV